LILLVKVADINRHVV